MDCCASSSSGAATAPTATSPRARCGSRRHRSTGRTSNGCTTNVDDRRWRRASDRLQHDGLPRHETRPHQSVARRRTVHRGDQARAPALKARQLWRRRQPPGRGTADRAARRRGDQRSVIRMQLLPARMSAAGTAPASVAGRRRSARCSRASSFATVARARCWRRCCNSTAMTNDSRHAKATLIRTVPSSRTAARASPLRASQSRGPSACCQHGLSCHRAAWRRRPRKQQDCHGQTSEALCECLPDRARYAGSTIRREGAFRAAPRIALTGEIAAARPRRVFQRGDAQSTESRWTRPRSTGRCSTSVSGSAASSSSIAAMLLDFAVHGWLLQGDYDALVASGIMRIRRQTRSTTCRTCSRRAPADRFRTDLACTARASTPVERRSARDCASARPWR